MRWKIFVTLVGLGLFAWLLVFYDRNSRYLGVGFSDMTVEFVVTDAETGQPIKGAVIAGCGNLHGNGVGRDLEYCLEVDETGTVRVPRRVMVDYNLSEFGWTSTSTVEPVAMSVTVSAPGYEKIEPIELYEPPYRGAAVRVGPGQWKLVVPIALRKSQS